MPPETTSLQVLKKTRALLDLYKASLGANTYDETIQKLIMKKTGSMAGKLKIKGVTTMAQLMKGLRDEHDRF